MTPAQELIQSGSQPDSADEAARPKSLLSEQVARRVSANAADDLRLLFRELVQREALSWPLVEEALRLCVSLKAGAALGVCLEVAAAVKEVDAGLQSWFFKFSILALHARDSSVSLAMIDAFGRDWPDRMLKRADSLLSQMAASTGIDVPAHMIAPLTESVRLANLALASRESESIRQSMQAASEGDKDAANGGAEASPLASSRLAPRL
jgi:hypothetical protein